MELLRFWYRFGQCIWWGGHNWRVEFAIRQEDITTNVFRKYVCRHCGVEHYSTDKL